MGKNLALFLFLALSSFTIRAQQAPFYNDIEVFKKLDSITPPAKNQILFVGSSSFTNWVNVQDYFPGYPILNRGFGGSSLQDVIRYADDIIFPYQPKQIVIYCGENDLAASNTVSPEIVFKRFTELFRLIRNRIPGVPIAFISIKPSPSRIVLLSKMSNANDLIEKFLKKNENAVFIDVYHPMLKSRQTVFSALFVDDNLHLNAQGYLLWRNIIEPYLLK